MTRSVTLAPILFGRRGRASAIVARIANVNLDDLQLGELTETTRTAVSGELATLLTGALDLDLGAVALGAWRTYRTVREAAAASASDPEVPRVVELATHTITSAYRPVIDVLINGVVVTRIAPELSLEFHVPSLSAVMRAGRLMELHTGRCRVAAALTLLGAEILRRECEIDLNLAVSVGSDGIALVPDIPAYEASIGPG